MADGTAIEWATATWNPLAGCSILSPGCINCYAMGDAHRLAGNPNPKIAAKYEGTTRLVKETPVWTGRVNLAREGVLLQPLRWTKPRLIFVNSMSDLFHESVPDEWIDRIFAVMALCPQHIFQILTKRSARMRAYLSTGRAHPVALEALGVTLQDHSVNPRSQVGRGIIIQGDIPHLKVWPLPNVWLGVSAEDQPRLEERWPDLAATPSAVRWISAEPLLGALDFMLRGPDMGDWDALRGREYWAGASCYAESANALKTTHPKIDWVVAGGENGPRPMHPQWVRDIRDQCDAADVSFFFKQWGTWKPICEMTEQEIDAVYHPAPALHPEATRRPKVAREVLHIDGTRFTDVAAPGAFLSGKQAMLIYEVGKKAAGRLLDGREHNAMPRIAA